MESTKGKKHSPPYKASWMEVMKGVIWRRQILLKAEAMRLKGNLRSRLIIQTSNSLQFSWCFLLYYPIWFIQTDPGRQYYYSHFIAEETETQRGQLSPTCLSGSEVQNAIWTRAWVYLSQSSAPSITFDYIFS